MESCIPFWVNAECKTKEDAHNEMMKIFLNLQEEKIRFVDIKILYFMCSIFLF